ncbi:MAG: (d)CMP kinase [Bacilli bacterium]|nr:(d)CMP kinase [Bacilli bacterium]
MKVAIDGPAGSGKGTISSILAKKCSLTYIDTGVTYRCVALKVIEKGIDLDDKDAIIDIASKIDIKFMSDGVTYLDGKDVSSKIRSKEVTSIVSPISSIPKVREYMVELQRNMANSEDVIMEGRDITTVVLPDADYKFYLDASIGERAKRRYIQNQEKGINMSLEEIKSSIETRDYNDMHKEVGALKRTDNQIYIDTSNLTIDEVVDSIRKVIGR